MNVCFSLPKRKDCNSQTALSSSVGKKSFCCVDDTPHPLLRVEVFHDWITVILPPSNFIFDTQTNNRQCLSQQLHINKKATELLCCKSSQLYLELQISFASCRINVTSIIFSLCNLDQNINIYTEVTMSPSRKSTSSSMSHLSATYDSGYFTESSGRESRNSSTTSASTTSSHSLLSTSSCHTLRSECRYFGSCQAHPGLNFKSRITPCKRR